jgi:threonylcarbamoyladenosine tRNA methylthiotransferase MtaB
MKKKCKVITLGCRTNQYESQAYLGQLDQLGYERSDKDADLCIINTCTVTGSADQKSMYQIRQAVRENPGARVVVTGCMVERRRKEIAAIEGVSDVVSNLEKEQLVAKIFPDIEKLPEFSIENFSARTRAFVKVQDGCNSYCSYCVIPYVRGRSRSRDVDGILEEITGLIASGYKEVVLTGINIGDFDGSGKKLSDLVRMVDGMEGLERLRISSIDPDEVDDDLLDAVIRGKKTCHSMHIVLQSGSNTILKRMRRKYTKQEFFEATDRLVAASSDFAFTTDVIVGFPGESEDDFQDSLDVIERVAFSKVHMFPYSERPMTRAARMDGKVDRQVITERKRKLMHAAELRGSRLREEYVGRTMSVLIESDDPMREGYVMGHTGNFLMVSLPKGNLAQNDLIDVQLLENGPDGLVGEVAHACAHC